MELRNSKPIKIKNNSTDLELQVLDWQCYDILPEEVTQDLEEDEDLLNHVIQILG